MKLLYYTLLFVILASCKDQKGQQDIGIWHFDVTKEYSKKELYIQDIADVDYIPLETNDSMLWLGRDIAFFDDDHIIAANPRTGVLIHNREGEALHSFHHLGGGPEEYRGLYFADYDKKEAFRKQKELLKLKKEKIERMISVLENAEKGEFNMSTIENAYEKTRKQYEAEAKEYAS